MKTTIILFFFLVGITSVFAQNHQDTLIIQSLGTGHSGKMKVSFESNSSLFKSLKKLYGGLYTLNSKGNVLAADLILKKKKDHWENNIEVADSCVAIVLNILTPGTNEIYKASVLKINSESKSPFKSGNNIMSLIYSGVFQSYMGISRDKIKQEKYLDLYFAEIKDSLTDIPSLIDYYTYKRDTIQLVKLVNSVFQKDDASEYEIRYAIQVVKGFLKLGTLGDSLLKFREIRFPMGEWKKSQLANIASSEKSSESQIRLLNNFRMLFPEESDTASSYIRRIKLGISANYANEGEVHNAVQYIPPALSNELLAKQYNLIAWGAYQNKKYITKALSLSKKSLLLIDPAKVSSMKKPPYDTKISFRKRLLESYSAYSHTYACLLFQDGQYKRGFKYAKISLSGIIKPEVEVIRDYHMIMEKVATPSDVANSIEKYIKKGLYDSLLLAQYRRLYTGNQSVDDYLKVLLAKFVEDRKDSFMTIMIDEIANNFSLFDLNGRPVTLKSYVNKIIVLDFWATWCTPCIASFPAMQQMVDRYRKDTNVVFLFIDTWESAADKKRKVNEYINSTTYDFHVLLDSENKVAESYKVPSLPTKFIIDRNGHIRFKILDYSGNVEETVKEMDEIIKIVSDMK